METEVTEKPKAVAPIVEEKCKVCGEWLDAGYFHNRCYSVDTTLRIEDQTEIAEIVQ